MKKRRRARELALQELYGWEISGNTIEVVLKRMTDENEAEEEIVTFASELLTRTILSKVTLDEDVVSVVENWEFGRIALIDRLILRLALCEFLHFEEIPPKVTINDAIDMAKKYSTSQSGRFVNGILDSLYQKYKSENRIKKRGRGLMD